ncbi:EamA domain-containing membrane protein RarD [Methylovorus glucosotrophus]|uniref:DMT family transporter n=1 Tax=Methylovorus glucosotrophus TaxID=266009 RepID=UPI0013318178|nr:DMT family transporter [Methylovorus glucosotrophus]KAF0843803.1 EamA domain-containing membrane protein RarD [Methylovorus glucosotrophus]
MNLFRLIRQWRLGSLWMLVAAFFFAIMGVLVKLGAQKFSSAELVFYRSFFGLVFIYGLTRIRKQSLATPLLSKHMWRAVLGFISLLLFFYAISELPLATAITLNYTSPLFMAALAPFYLGEKFRKTLFVAIALGFVGVTLLLKPSLHVDELIAGALGLLSGALAGIVYIHVTQLGRAGEPDWRTVFYFTLVCTLGGGIWMLVHDFHRVEWDDLLLLIGLGVSATIAQLALTRAYRTGNPLVVGSLAYSTVVLASVFGIVIWGEMLSLDRWFAVAIIVLSGVISVTSRKPQNKA